jgi:hypothetical protein
MRLIRLDARRRRQFFEELHFVFDQLVKGFWCAGDSLGSQMS